MNDQKDPRYATAMWWQDRLLRLVLGALLLLPYRTRVPVTGWLVGRIVAPAVGYSRRVEQNLALVLPDLPKSEVARLCRAVPNNVGRTLIEFYSGADFVAHVKKQPITGPGLAALDEAHAAHRPVIFVTGHFGNYDACRAAMLARGFNVGALYRPMNNGWFNDHYVEAIETIGTPLFPRGKKGLGDMVRFIRSAGMLGIVIDQYNQTGARLRFFGREALTTLSAAELALKYKALMVPVYGIRAPNGIDFEIVVEAPIPPSTPEVMTQALNDSLEAQVRQHLDQWFWIHRRWKPAP